MTIHKHSINLTALTPLSRSTSSEAHSNGGSNPTTRTQSTSSIASMLSSLATTPDYSPQLIDTEVGDLLNIDDLELGVNDDNSGTEELHSVCSTTELGGDGIDELLCGGTEHCDSETRYDPQLTDLHKKWFVCLIGLPACGKSTVVKQLIDFAKRMTGEEGIRIASFNAGEVRRKHESEDHKLFTFDLQDADTQREREQYAFEALQNLTDELITDKIDVGILDATNTTRARREAVFRHVHAVSKKSKVKVGTLILEVKCKNKSLRRYNIEQKASNGDYVATPKDQAIVDFLKRIEKYEAIYEKVTVDEINHLGAKYFSITNAGECVCYDCGLAHHDSQTHQHMHFKNAALNLIYDFVMCYRLVYAADYLQNVDDFYTKGGYKPVATDFAKEKEVPLIKVLSSTRI